jgi:long-chain acyl-CoA synthetase
VKTLAPGTEGAALSEHPKVLEAIQGAIDGANAGLARFEQIKRFAVLERELSQDAGELTPSLKIKRRVVDQRYAEKIEGLYEGHRMPAAS